MVGGEVHAYGIGTNGSFGFGEVCPEVFHGALALRYTVHQVVQLPAVVHVECRLGEFLRLGFILGKGEQVGVVFADIRHRPVPEVGGDFACYVAAEAVDTDRVHPPAHATEHFVAHVLVLVVEFGDVGPIVLHHEVAEGVAVVPAFVLGPFAIGRGVVGNPIEDNLKAHLVRFGEEMLEVGACAELGVDGAIVDDRIVTAERAFACDDADRLARHYPDDVNTRLFEFGQHGFCGCECPFGSQLARIEFVDSSIIRPVGVGLGLLRLATHPYQRNGCKEKKRNAFHSNVI